MHTYFAPILCLGVHMNLGGGWEALQKFFHNLFLSDECMKLLSFLGTPKFWGWGPWDAPPKSGASATSIPTTPTTPNVSSSKMLCFCRHFLTMQSVVRCQRYKFAAVLKAARGLDCLKSLRYLTTVYSCLFVCISLLSFLTRITEA